MDQPSDQPIEVSEAQLAAQVEALAQACESAQLQLAAAESCTGGWLAKLCTDRAGSSVWFERGVVVYSNAAKTDLAGVPPALIQAHGAVSRPVAEALVNGLLARSPADLAVGITGIAGPGGGTDDKPVGLVWIAWQRRGMSALVREFRFKGERGAVRAQAVSAGLQGLLALASGEAPDVG